VTQLLILILYLKDLDSSDEYNRKHLMVEYIITGNPQREERYDYPLDAIREIVLNMIVHRDYRDSSDSVIKIFDDRIEFFNPGDLYDDLTIEQLESNNYESKTRNKLIALMFKECGLIEKYGSGISRIKKFCLEHDIVEPEFKEMQKGFKVTLYKQKRSENSDVGINVGINDIFEFIKKVIELLLNKKNIAFLLPSEVNHTLNYKPKTISVLEPTSWADTERDLSAWLSNSLQWNAMKTCYELLKLAKEKGRKDLIPILKTLTTSDLFYYMCIKYFQDGDVHKYFSPYSSPEGIYRYYMNILSDIEEALEE